MGFAGFSADTSPATYAANSSTGTNAPVDTKPDFSRMTVAELRNRLNHISKYYDSYNAKAFLEDPTISDVEKVIILCGSMITDKTLDDLISNIK